MLKKVFFAIAVASLLSAACQKEVFSENTPVSMIETRVSFTTAGTPASLDTKAQFGTKTGDTYPRKPSSVPKPAIPIPSFGMRVTRSVLP